MPRPNLVKLITQMAVQKKFSFLEPALIDESTNLFGRLTRKIMNEHDRFNSRYGGCNC